MADDKGTVCVTGATGYVASWLIMRLLQHGYSVHATIRSHHDKEKKDLTYLTNLQEATKKLKIFHADLDDSTSFEKAIQGCIGVFHLAHPMDVQNQEPEEKVTKRAMEGTLGILKACLESKTVKKLVYTSSLTTVMFNDKNLDVVDEDIWSDIEICKSSNLVGSSYMVSKILTEKSVLEFGKVNGLEVVSLVLPLVVGPFICPMIPSSVYLALAMIFVQESSLLTEVERDFNDIKDDLVSIQAFLKNADTKAAANEGVQTWVKQLREASFRIEDVIDEYIMHEAQKINQSRSIATLQMIPNMI
ncbi:bifunctional dihydroflavonol 4-reductase/flavanone 4-reductase, partial [Trifolium pratense]